MGWFFRKIFNLGPVRASLTKRGVGFSFGISPVRVGTTADGRKYARITIPRTGISFVKYFKAPRKKESSKVKQPDAPASSTGKWWEQKGLT